MISACSRYWSVGTAATLVLIASMLWNRAVALPPTEADGTLAPWFKGLTAPDTLSSCCDLSDCRVTQSRHSGGHYEVWIGNKWVEVPEDKVLDDVGNPTSGAVLCYSPKLGIICFVPEPAS